MEHIPYTAGDSMKKILLLEDDNIQTANLKRIITNYFNKDIQVFCVNTITQAKKILMDDIIFDAFFLDISLNQATPDHVGLSFAVKLQQMPRYKKTPILFITAFPEYVYSAINQLHCYAYIVKPYTDKDVHLQLDNLFKNENILFLKTTDGIYIRLSIDTLQYIQSSGRYLTFVTDTTSYCSRQYTLKKVLTVLPNEFVRCHKSYIINQRYVKNFDFVNCYAHMQTNNEIIPLSRDFQI